MVTRAQRGQLELAVRHRRVLPAPDPVLAVVQAIPKGERGQLAVELMTEAGVDVIVPWAAERCVARWQGERGERAVARWRSTAREAAKQARRSRVPRGDRAPRTSARWPPGPAGPPGPSSSIRRPGSCSSEVTAATLGGDAGDRRPGGRHHPGRDRRAHPRRGPPRRGWGRPCSAPHPRGWRRPPSCSAGRAAGPDQARPARPREDRPPGVIKARWWAWGGPALDDAGAPALSGRTMAAVVAGGGATGGGTRRRGGCRLPGHRSARGSRVPVRSRSRTGSRSAWPSCRARPSRWCWAPESGCRPPRAGLFTPLCSARSAPRAGWALTPAAASTAWSSPSSRRCPGQNSGLDVETELVGPIRVCPSWLRMTTPTTTIATAAETASTGLSQAPAGPRRPGEPAVPRCPPEPAGLHAGRAGRART